MPMILFDQNYDGNQEKKLKQIRITLKERLDTSKTLDEEILQLIEADEEISTEIEEAGKYRESVHEMIVNIDSVLEAKPINETMSMRLRRLYDQIEVHVRGLKSLDVPDTDYGALLLPILIGKIPDEIRILRNMTGETWNLNTLLENFREELENRERCEGIQALSFRDGRNSNEQRGGRKYSNTPFTAAARIRQLLTVRFVKKNIRQLVVLLLRISKQENRSYESKDDVFCVSNEIISLGIANQATRQELNSRQQLRNVQDSLDKEQTTQSMDTKNTGSTKETRNYQVCLQDSVLLQTAKAKVGVGNKKLTTEIRVIFYSGSQRSYLTQRVRNKLQLPTGSTESLRIKTFGECETELTASCEIVNLAVGDITGRTRTQVEGFVVPVICAPLGNQEIDRAQVEYKHLSDLNLADNNEGDGVAEIDLLIGADQIGLENPADIGSRGQKASELAQNDLWWKGPQWLTLDPSAYPDPEFAQSDVELTDECMKECRVKLPTKGNTTVVNVANVSETHPPETVGSTKLSEIIDHKSYSSVTKLFRVTAWVKRFIRNLKTKKACGKIDPLLKPSTLTIEEINDAEKIWIREIQEHVNKQKNYQDLTNQLGLYADKDHYQMSQWKIGRVEALLKSKDGEVRGVKLRALNKKGKPIVLRRPIQKLVPLEIKEERKNEDSKDPKDDADIQNEVKPTRQRRIAAANADLKRQSMIDQL
ncbi:Hypothetical predicted protein [Paramuricea clavata]|uniref:Uncharacterized protein n=1 Tax=Paramuricea clavata TaxID=317549 RepID=A0A6S7IFB5_PARCT|nr:Hypothetical predicted protein [Paramuricea clavata]